MAAARVRAFFDYAIALGDAANMPPGLTYAINPQLAAQHVEMHCSPEAKALDRLVLANTRHVTFAEFLHNFHAALRKFFAQLAGPYALWEPWQRAVLTQDGFVAKSNYWCMVLAAQFIARERLPPPIDVLLLAAPEKIQMLFPEMHGVTWLVVDDISYSGFQLSQTGTKLARALPGNMFAACVAYVLEAAQARLAARGIPVYYGALITMPDALRAAHTNAIYTDFSQPDYASTHAELYVREPDCPNSGSSAPIFDVGQVPKFYTSLHLAYPPPGYVDPLFAFVSGGRRRQRSRPCRRRSVRRRSVRRSPRR